MSVHDYFPRPFLGPATGMLLLAAALGACSRSAPPTPHASPAPAAPGTPPVAAAPPAPAAAATPRAWQGAPHEAMMRAIFGAGYRQDSGDALAVIASDGADGTYLMTHVASAELPDGRIAVVVNGALSDESGNDVAGHGQPGMLNVYMLQRQGSDWKVLERHQNVASLGSDGHFSDVHWIGLGPGKPGFIVSSGGVWQGYSISVADIFELGNGVRTLGSFKESSSNAGACTPDSRECWDIDSTLRIADNGLHAGYPDLLADFKGKRYTVTAAGPDKEVEHLKTAIRQTARYRFDGKAYQLVEGTNPAPDI